MIIQIALRQALVDRFSDGELRHLCFDLNIDNEQLPGEGKGGKARELVAHATRHGRLDELARKVRLLRPDIV